MKMSWLLAPLISALAACQSVPRDPNQLPLNASSGVKAHFENDSDTTHAAQDIRCETRKKTGSKMSTRVCRTNAEWAAQRSQRVMHRWSEVDASLGDG